MSQQTYMVWYTASSSVDPILILREVPRILGLEKAESVHRTTNSVQGPEQDCEAEDLGIDIPAERLPLLYQPGSTLHVADDFAKAGDLVLRAITYGIDKTVRGEHPPCRAILVVGGHYFVDDADDTDTVIRYSALVGFWEYTTPANYGEMRRVVFQLPAIRRLKRKLERAMGPLHDAMYLRL
jgi:hypothetical protein